MGILEVVGSLDNAQPHFMQLQNCGAFRPVVASLLCEAMNNTWGLAVIGLVYCVVHV